VTDVSVIVISFNTRDLLHACLASVTRCHAAEVIVVDNGSSDGSVAMVQREYPAVRLIASAQNLGFVRANNLALRQATGMHLLLLNPDAELLPGALEELQDFLDAHERAAIVGPQLQYPDGSLQHAAFRFPTLLQTYFEFFPHPARLLASGLNGRYPTASYRGSPFQADFVLGACLLARREAVEHVGLLDESYFMYCEEMDWCWRFRRAGWSVWCDPRARVVHHEAQSSRQTRWESYVEKWRSRRRFYARYYPAWWQATNRLIIRVGLWAEERRARLAHQRGEISPDELAGRVAAYERVAEIMAQPVA
jgi:hypothetical protein